MVPAGGGHAPQKSWETLMYNVCWEGKCTTTDDARARPCNSRNNFRVQNHGSLDINPGSKRILLARKVFFK